MVLLLEHMAVKFHYSQAYYGKDCVAIWIWYLLFLLHKSISFFFIFGQLANVTIDSSRVVWTASLISYNVSPLNFILIPSIFAVWSCVSAEEERGGKGETSSQFYMVLVIQLRPKFADTSCCVFVAWTGTEGSEGQGTEGCDRRLWLEEKREEMSLSCVSGKW